MPLSSSSACSLQAPLCNEASELHRTKLVENKLLGEAPRCIQIVISTQMPCRVHGMFPDSWDWSGRATAAAVPRHTLQAANGSTQQGAGGSTETMRELGELQLAYCAMLGEIAMYDLLPCLEQGQAFNLALSALAQVC